jgi:hypothetical protein
MSRWAYAQATRISGQSASGQIALYEERVSALDISPERWCFDGCVCLCIFSDESLDTYPDNPVERRERRSAAYPLRKPRFRT